MTDDVVIWDDGENFWSTLFATFSNDISDKKHGANSLKIVTNSNSEMYHQYNLGLLDASVNDDISFWFKGCNSGATWEIDFYNLDYSLNSATWVDNSSGWQLISIPRSSFSPSGNPEWNTIFIIDIYNLDNFSGTVHFDYLVNGSGIIPTVPDVTIGAFSPDFILSFSKAVTNSVAIPEWLNQLPIIDTNVYNREVTKLQYTFRASDKDKYTVDKMLLAHTLINLTDFINQITGDVWMTDIQARYTPINFDRPWEVTITLISSDLVSTNHIVVFSSQQINCGSCGEPPCTQNQGAIIIDGVSHNLPISISLSNGTHTIEYDPTVEFDSWNVSGNNSVNDSGANPAILTVVENGTVEADYLDYLVNLSTNIDNPCSSASINIGGTIYDTPRNFYEVYGDLDIQVSAYPTGMYANNHAFDHWIVSGGVTVDDIYAITTTMHITGDGTLEAYYHPIDVKWDSYNKNNPTGDHSKGTISSYGVPYSLPQDWVVASRFTHAPISWSGYTGKTFDHWEVTGACTVADINSQTTTASCTDSGTIKAVYY